MSFWCSYSITFGGFSLNFDGNKKNQSPSGIGPCRGWCRINREGLAGEKIAQKPKLSPRQKLTHFWCFKLKIKLSDTVSESKYCKKLLFQVFGDECQMEELALVQKGMSVIWEDWSNFHLMGDPLLPLVKKTLLLLPKNGDFSLFNQ